MKEIVVTGAGRIGSAIADMLVASGDYTVTVADRSAEQLAGLLVSLYKCVDSNERQGERMTRLEKQMEESRRFIDLWRNYAL